MPRRCPAPSSRPGRARCARASTASSATGTARPRASTGRSMLCATRIWPARRPPAVPWPSSATIPSPSRRPSRRPPSACLPTWACPCSCPPTRPRWSSWASTPRGCRASPACGRRCASPRPSQTAPRPSRSTVPRWRPLPRPTGIPRRRAPSVRRSTNSRPPASGCAWIAPAPTPATAASTASSTKATPIAWASSAPEHPPWRSRKPCATSARPMASACCAWA